MDRGDDWAEQRKKALERDHYTCRKCWKKTTSVHHIFQFKRTASNKLEEIIVVCPSCHRQEEINFIKYGITGWMKRQIKTNQRL